MTPIKSAKFLQQLKAASPPQSSTYGKQINKQNKRKTHKQTRETQTKTKAKNPTPKKTLRCHFWRVGNSLCLCWTVTLWQRCCSHFSATAPCLTKEHSLMVHAHFASSEADHEHLPSSLTARGLSINSMTRVPMSMYFHLSEKPSNIVFPLLIYLNKSTLHILQKTLRCTFPLIFNLNGWDISICLLLLTKR